VVNEDGIFIPYEEYEENGHVDFYAHLFICCYIFNQIYYEYDFDLDDYDPDFPFPIMDHHIMFEAYSKDHNRPIVGTIYWSEEDLNCVQIHDYVFVSFSKTKQNKIQCSTATDHLYLFDPHTFEGQKYIPVDPHNFFKEMEIVRSDD
jgi:hypothetical protein